MVTFCVVVNNYNYGRFLRECLNSVFNQTLQASEVIVVDDGSTDDSMTVLSEYKNKLSVIVQENSGQLAAIRAGVERSNGVTHIAFLDSDDVWHPKHLEYMAHSIALFPKAEFFFADKNLFDDVCVHTDFSFPETPVLLGKRLAYASVLRSLDWTGRETSALCIRRDAVRVLLHEFQDCDHRFRVCADEVLVWGADILGYTKVSTGNKTLYYRTHGSNFFYNNSDLNLTYRRIMNQEIFLQKLLRGEMLATLLVIEYKILENFNLRVFLKYFFAVSRLNAGLKIKLRVRLAMIKNFSRLFFAKKIIC